LDVLKMARNGLMLPLRAAIAQAKKVNKTVRRDNVRVEHEGTTRTVSLHVIPLKNLRERSFLIVFHEGRPTAPATPATRRPSRHGKTASVKTARSDRADLSRRIAELEADLVETRDYLQAPRNSTRRRTKSCKPPTRKCSRPTRNCKASTKNWRPRRRNWNQR